MERRRTVRRAQHPRTPAIYLDQPVAPLFDPQPPPQAVQISIFEEFNQVVGQKPGLEEHSLGQKF
jgi:hypothetical protein